MVNSKPRLQDKWFPGMDSFQGKRGRICGLRPKPTIDENSEEYDFEILMKIKASTLERRKEVDNKSLGRKNKEIERMKMKQKIKTYYIIRNRGGM
jgi:hypothetical protein